MICRFCGDEFDREYNTLNDDYKKEYIPNIINEYVCDVCSITITELIITKRFNQAMIKRLKENRKIIKNSESEELFNDFNDLEFKTNITYDTTIDDIENIGLDEEKALQSLKGDEKKLELYKTLYNAINPTEYFKCDLCDDIFHKRLMYYAYDCDEDPEDAQNIICYSCSKYNVKDRNEDIRDFYKDFDPEYDELTDVPKPFITVSVFKSKIQRIISYSFLGSFLVAAILCYFLVNPTILKYFDSLGLELTISNSNIVSCVLLGLIGFFIADSIMRFGFLNNLYIKVAKIFLRFQKFQFRVLFKGNRDRSSNGFFENKPILFIIFLCIVIPLTIIWVVIYILLWILFPILTLLITMIFSPFIYVIDLIRLSRYSRIANKVLKSWHNDFEILVDNII